MPYDYHIFLTVIAFIFGAISYVPYFRDIARGKTKPHLFSWLIFAILSSIIFAAQLIKGGGIGAWVAGFTAFVCLVIAVVSFWRGEKNIAALDWWCLIGALAGIVLWTITSDPLFAVIIVTLVDIIAYIPTARKSYIKPYEETISTWVLNTFKWFISIGGLQSVTLTTVFFPAVIVPTNILFITMLLVRRRQVNRDLVIGSSAGPNGSTTGR